MGFLCDSLPPRMVTQTQHRTTIRLQGSGLVRVLNFIRADKGSRVNRPVVECRIVDRCLRNMALSGLLRNHIYSRAKGIVPFTRRLRKGFLGSPCDFTLAVMQGLLSNLVTLRSTKCVRESVSPSGVVVASDNGVGLVSFNVTGEMGNGGAGRDSCAMSKRFVKGPGCTTPRLIENLISSRGAAASLCTINVLLCRLLINEIPFSNRVTRMLRVRLAGGVPLRGMGRGRVGRIVQVTARGEHSRHFRDTTRFQMTISGLIPLPCPRGPVSFGAVMMTLKDTTIFTKFIVNTVGVFDSSRSSSTGADRVVARGIAARRGERRRTSAGRTRSCSLTMGLLSGGSATGRKLIVLECLTSGGSCESTFLLDELCFSDPRDVGVNTFTSSITRFQGGLNVSTRGERTRELLGGTITLGSRSCESLFRLKYSCGSGGQKTVFSASSTCVCLGGTQRLTIGTKSGRCRQTVTSQVDGLGPTGR